jgi:hypothetical protein
VRHFFGALGHKGHGNARTAGASERLLPPPAFGRERGHRGLARRLVAVGWRAPAMGRGAAVAASVASGAVASAALAAAWGSLFPVMAAPAAA